MDDLKGELYALRRERGQASQSDFESTQRVARLEKDLAKASAAAEKSSAELVAVRTDLAALVIRFEDSQSALEERNSRLVSLQSVADDLTDEAATKTAGNHNFPPDQPTNQSIPHFFFLNANRCMYFLIL